MARSRILGAVSQDGTVNLFRVIGAVAIGCRPFRSGLSPLVAAAIETVLAILERDLGGRWRPTIHSKLNYTPLLPAACGCRSRHVV